MVQLSRLTNTKAALHTVTVTLPLANETGVVVEEKIRVVYRGFSLRESKALEDKYDGRPMDEALPELLAENIESLPDILDGEAPVKITPDFFASLDTFVLHRINKAVREDRSANPTS